MTGRQGQDLIDIRKKMGMEDKRDGLQECQLCDNSEFQPGVVCDIPAASSGSAGGGNGGPLDPDAENLVQSVTDQIVASTKG